MAADRGDGDTPVVAAEGLFSSNTGHLWRLQRPPAGWRNSISEANEIPGSQTGSQRRQTSGDTRRLLATINATSWLFRRRQATSRDGSVSPYKRGVRRFKSYCAHNFRILDPACRSVDPRSRRYILPEWGESGATSGCRERRRHVPVLLGMGTETSRRTGCGAGGPT